MINQNAELSNNTFQSSQPQTNNIVSIHVRLIKRLTAPVLKCRNSDSAARYYAQKKFEKPNIELIQ